VPCGNIRGYAGGKSASYRDRWGRHSVTTNEGSLDYPGEFEVLRTKAEAGSYDSGTLVLTNYRLTWTPSRFSQKSAFSVDFEKIASVRQFRSIKYLFLMPSLRITLRDGTLYEIHNPKEDLNRVQHLIEDYRSRERYRPGSLFGNGS
jgi:hypothetical protein